MRPSDIEKLPKAVLHDHLDGGVRLETLRELADDTGYSGLPTADLADLEDLLFQGRSGSLEQYLEAFRHTVGVVQTPDALRRVAYEGAIDLAADGVVYAEIRVGPSLHLQQGLSREDVLEAVIDGFAAGARDTGIYVGTIPTALRDGTDSEEVARAAVQFADQGVVGFDLAGPEAGYPPDDHLAACLVAREGGLGLTIHAGEADGPHSIWRALALCGAQRIGHGTSIIDDTEVVDGQIVALGAVARRVRDHRIPLEVSITSNLHIGAFVDAESHPFGALYREGFNVTINTDNRLMSRISVSDEYTLAAATYGLSRENLGEITEAAVVAGFGDWPERKRLIDEVIRPAYGLD